MMSMNNEEQRVNIRVSDISVSIAPAAVRTLIGVTSALGAVQVSNERVKESRIMLFLDQ
jgi:hypothetical protein